jgi:MinD-like ATPase involved in chromosome partitioning or flagellar assembly
VLLIGLDLRNPRLNEFLRNIPEAGLSSYLSSNDVKLEDLIVKQKGYDDLYILPAGAIPNSAELLMGKKVDIVFQTLKPSTIILSWIHLLWV